MKVGFLEYQLTNSHFKKFHTLLTGVVGGGEVTIVAADELEPTDAGKKWCADNNVKYCESAEEVIAASDAILVLGPNNPEKHLELAGPALASGKPVFIDKQLAATPEHAQAIIDVAAKARTPLMSSSAVRFAVELDELDKTLKGEPETVFIRGYGKFPIYAVHSVAMLLRYFSKDLKRVIDTGSGPTRLLTIESAKGKASLEVRDSANGAQVNPWQVGVLEGGKYQLATVKNTDAFYENLMRKALHFFKTGESAVTNEEMLGSVKIQYAAEQSAAKGGEWVNL